MRIAGTGSPAFRDLGPRRRGDVRTTVSRSAQRVFGRSPRLGCRPRSVKVDEVQFRGSVKCATVPPHSDAPSQSHPPSRSTISQQILARPVPLPDAALRGPSHWNISHARSRSAAGMPIPVVRDAEVPRRPPRDARRRRSRAVWKPRKLSTLPIRFSKPRRARGRRRARRATDRSRPSRRPRRSAAGSDWCAAVATLPIATGPRASVALPTRA